MAAADVLVIGTPIYNFSIPAALKAWVDASAEALGGIDCLVSNVSGGMNPLWAVGELVLIDDQSTNCTAAAALGIDDPAVRPKALSGEALVEVEPALADAPVSWHSRLVLHCSGFLTSDVLAPLAELGAAVIAPNIRGSTGYDSNYLALDNGYRREDAVRDIGALLDWIATQPDLDENRVAIHGTSYGGYIVLAAAVNYSDRLRAGVDYQESEGSIRRTFATDGTWHQSEKMTWTAQFETQSVDLGNLGIYDQQWTKLELELPPRWTIDAIADILRDCQTVQIEISGHTDSQGREVMNEQLSQARADAVLNAIMARRVLTSNLTAKGYGESQPIADNGTEEGREANRRIEFRLVTPETANEDAADVGLLAAVLTLGLHHHAESTPVAVEIIHVQGAEHALQRAEYAR